MGWIGTKNGKLIALAEADGFRFLITIDQNLSYQQNISARRLAVIVVSVQSNHIRFYQPLFPQLNQAVDRAKDGEVIRVNL
jgi:hypothetical protein